MNKENEVDIANVLEKNAAIMDEAIQIMKTQSYQIQVLVDEIRAWRAFWYTPGNMERMTPVTEAVGRTNLSQILKNVPGIQGQNIGV